MELYPAIDLRGGRAVRLWQGDFDKETVYGADPVAVARRFVKAGVRFSTGTDTNSFLNFMQKDPMANEMMSMVELGMAPLDVIVASTKNGAETVGLAKSLGTIEAGKLADVIVVAGNPLQNMQAMKRVAYVVKGGVRFK